MRGFWLAMLSLAAVGAIVLGFFLLRVQPIKRPATDAANAPEAALFPTVTFVNPSKGAAGATVTIVEYADFQCAPCAQLAVTLGKLLQAREDVRVVWKDMPNEGAHPFAVPAAIAAHCADRQGRFWDYHDALFARQSSLSPETFARIAQDLRLDEAAFNGCTDAQETLAIIRKDHLEGIGLGISSTPTLYVGTKKVEGAPTLEELTGYVEEAAR